jgi:hypothetical protein
MRKYCHAAGTSREIYNFAVLEKFIAFLQAFVGIEHILK